MTDCFNSWGVIWFSFHACSREEWFENSFEPKLNCTIQDGKNQGLVTILVWD